MVPLHPVDLDIMAPNARYAAEAARRVARRRTWTALCDACSSGMIAPGALVIVGLYALLVLTGAGPDGWQARQCADGNLQPRSCGARPPAPTTTGATRLTGPEATS